MSITFPEKAQAELETALRVAIVYVGVLLALQAVSPPP